MFSSNTEFPNSKFSKDYSHQFETLVPREIIFKLLMQPEKWWTGLFEETIKGRSKKEGDVFEFFAGNGVHFSKQILIEIIPNKKIVWEVIDSNLSFLTNTNEWSGTKIRFDIKLKGTNTIITFTHEGLTPGIECFADCSVAWTSYIKRLEAMLK